MLTDLIVQFITYLRVERNYSVHTTKGYGADLKMFEQFCKTRHITLLDIDTNTIRQFLAHLFVTGHAPRTVRRFIAALRSFFRFALEQADLQKNPMLPIRSPKVEERLPIYLSAEELSCLLASADNKRDRAILTLLAMTGIRLDELVQLDLNHICLNNSTGSVRVLGKGSKERLLPLNRIAINALQAYLHCRPDVLSPALFVSRQKKRLMGGAVQDVLKKYVGRAGIKKITPHSLRHTCATLLYREGVPLLEIKELLGHINFNSTIIYTRCNPAGLKTAVGKLDLLISD